MTSSGRRIAVGIVLTLCFSSPSWAAQGCTVNAVAGTPVIVHKGQATPPKPGDALQKGDVIQTPTHVCRVDMSMNDLAGVRVLGQSQLEVTGWKPENMGVRIVDGNIVLNLKKLPKDSEFKVESPTAIAAVRGTQFWGRVSRPTPENPVTTFAVRQGSVEIFAKDAGRTVVLEPGKALDLKLGDKEPVVRDALPAEMQAMEQADTIASEKTA